MWLIAMWQWGKQVSHEMEQKEMVMFVCSQLPKQKHIMPKKSSSEVQSTKDLVLGEINQRPPTKFHQTNKESYNMLFSLAPVS